MTKPKPRLTACEHCGGALPPSTRRLRFCGKPCGDASYRARNRDRLNTQTAAWARANPERRQAARRRWADRNPTYQAEYREQNAERLSAYHQVYRVENADTLLPRKRVDTLRSRYKITMEQYDEMLAVQGGVCAICGKPERAKRRLAVDHDRKCCPGRTSCGKCVRKLLCTWCNNRLSALEDDDWTENAMAYLKANKR